MCYGMIASFEIMCLVKLPPTIKLPLSELSKMYSIYALVFVIFYPAHGSICIPTLSDSTPDMEHFKQIDCKVSSCSNISQLRFEKKISKQWTPVYERVNKTYHQSLDTNLSQYSLRNRSDYIDFQIKHVLYINPPTLEDQGKWRCVVHDTTGSKYASKAMDINIYVTPPENLWIVPNNVELYTSQTTEFMCMAYSIHPVPGVLWVVNGTDQHAGTPSIKKHADGMWFVMNTIKLSFDIAGVADLRCIMRTNERNLWMQNDIRIIVKDTKTCNRAVTTLPDDINHTPSNINLNVINQTCHAALYVTVSMFCVLFAIVIGWLSICLWKTKGLLLSERNTRGNTSSSIESDNRCPIRFGIASEGLLLSERKEKENRSASIESDNRCQIRFGKASKGKQRGMIEESRCLLSDMQSPICQEDDFFKTRENSWSIWSSTDLKCVFIGGQSSPSITYITESTNPTACLLSTGTYIVYGLFIRSTFHLINVYDEASQKHFIYCISIDSTAEQLTPRSTLQLNDEIIEPHCMFAMKDSSIGIYCAKTRRVEVFKTDKIPSSASPVDIIKLTGYDANENDSLCSNEEGHICVLSYKYRNVYIYDKRGEYIYNFNTGMWYDPIHIQCFSDNSLAVVNLYGEVRRYKNGSAPQISNLGENTYVQAAVLTRSLVGIVDALDSTKIHVFKTGFE